jgi:hypothetical protein
MRNLVYYTCAPVLAFTWVGLLSAGVMLPIEGHWWGALALPASGLPFWAGSRLAEWSA